MINGELMAVNKVENFNTLLMRKGTKLSIFITKTTLVLNYSTLISACRSADYLHLNVKTGINRIFSIQSSALPSIPAAGTSQMPGTEH